MAKIDYTVCKKCGKKLETAQPILVHIARYQEKIVDGADGKPHTEKMYMIENAAHLCDDCAKELNLFLNL